MEVCVTFHLVFHLSLQYNGVYTLKGFVVTATNPAFLKEGGNALQVELMEASILDPVEVDVPGIVPNYVKLNLLDEKGGETIGEL